MAGIIVVLQGLEIFWLSEKVSNEQSFTSKWCKQGFKGNGIEHSGGARGGGVGEEGRSL